ncbi:MAG: hypothetical protein B6D41_11790, partial [Chloroflexi bacterium UTCFX4]
MFASSARVMNFAKIYFGRVFQVYYAPLSRRNYKFDARAGKLYTTLSTPARKILFLRAMGRRNNNENLSFFDAARYVYLERKHSARVRWRRVH